MARNMEIVFEADVPTFTITDDGDEVLTVLVPAEVQGQLAAVVADPNRVLGLVLLAIDRDPK